MLVPVLNEARLLGRAVTAMREQELDGELEILVIDGGSSDGSRDIVAGSARSDDRIRLLDNPAGRTPEALNVGLRAARGAYVVRMDAHTWYPRDYVARGIERLGRGDVACASGPQLAVGDQPTSRAVALALQSPLGVGGARFRRAATQEEDVDSGFCGVWRRDLLLELGGWDEDWPVNQDAELAARIHARGGRIVCLPEMAAPYVPRSSLRALARQYWRYGQYRVKTAGRHPDGLRRSHVLPPGLVGIVASAALPTRLVRPARWGLALYGTVLLAEGARLARRHSAAELAPRVPAALATMHLAWGAGFLEGCRRFGVPSRALTGLVRRPAPRLDSAGRDLRIGYVVSRFPALSETFVLRELVEIDRRPGVRCELFSLFPERDEPVHPAARQWVARRRRASPSGAARALAYWGAHRPLRLAAVISTLVRDYLQRPRVLGRALVAVAYALQHARTLRLEPVDHLHAHFATYPALAAWTCSRLVGVPYSFTPTRTTSSSTAWDCNDVSAMRRSASASRSTTHASCATSPAGRPPTSTSFTAASASTPTPRARGRHAPESRCASPAWPPWRPTRGTACSSTPSAASFATARPSTSTSPVTVPSTRSSDANASGWASPTASSSSAC